MGSYTRAWVGCCVYASVFVACTERAPEGELPEGIERALVTDQRAGWLRDRLLEDNRDLLERYPELAKGKLRKMAVTPYNYFRGTNNIWLRDATEPGPYNAPTAHGSARASHVMLVGDPHPENIGSYRSGQGQMVIDFNDFDAATYGPYHLGVRRLTLGFHTLGREASAWMTEEQRAALLEAVPGGYFDEMQRIADGEAPTSFAWPRGEGEGAAGTILGDLIRRAERDGDDREELDEYTVVEGGRREMFYGELEAGQIEGVFGDTLLEPTRAQRAGSRRCWRSIRRRSWRRTRCTGRPRRFGSRASRSGWGRG